MIDSSFGFFGLLSLRLFANRHVRVLRLVSVYHGVHPLDLTVAFVLNFRVRVTGLLELARRLIELRLIVARLCIGVDPPPR